MMVFIKKKQGIFATVIIILAIVMACLFSQTTYGVLYKDMDMVALDTLHTFIHDMGVPVRVEGTTILIPKNRIAEVKVALAAHEFVLDNNSSSSVGKIS